MKYSFHVWLDEKIYAEKFELTSPSLEMAIHNFFLNRPGNRSPRYTIRVLEFNPKTGSFREFGLVRSK